MASTYNRALCRTAVAAAFALSSAGCSAGLANVGVKPSVRAVQPGGVVTGSPSAPPGTSAPPCDVRALSSRPNAAAAASDPVQRIKARGKLIVGVAQDGYLTGYLDATGSESGFDIDIARQVEKALFGTDDAAHIQYKAVTNAQRITDLQNGVVDLVVDTFTITCDRAKLVDFSTEYYEGSQRLLVLADSGYKSLADLGGKTVCAQTDSTSIAAIAAYKSHPIPYGVKNLSDCLVALQQNQVDAISTDDTILAGLGKQDQNTRVVGTAIEGEPYGIAVANANPDLTRYVNAVLEQIRSDGTWSAIYAKWLEPYLGAAQPPVAHYRD
jgi:polar amino acid transport system substrate-binding protein